MRFFPAVFGFEATLLTVSEFALIKMTDHVRCLRLHWGWGRLRGINYRLTLIDFH